MLSVNCQKMSTPFYKLMSVRHLLRFCATVLLLPTVMIGCKKEPVQEPVPNLANCHIVRETYKSDQGIGKDKPETITVEGKSAIIYPQSTMKYSYDQQGRLSREENEPDPGKESFWTTYAYAPTAITKVQRILREPDGIINLTTMIPLNDRGLDARQQYDQGGYPVDSTNTDGTIKIKRVDGNVVQTWEYFSDMTIIDTYTFDLTRLNLPNKYPFNGRTNKNLITQMVGYSPNSIFYKPGELYRINIYYEFDQYKRVKRRIKYFRNDYNSGYPYLPDGVTVGVTDYEYECP